MSKSITLQFFAADVLARIEDPAKPVLTDAISGIVPTDGNYRTDMARFRGSLADMAAARQRTYQAYAVPAGTALAEAEGANGTSVAGQSAFMSVDADVVVDLGVGTSAEIRQKFAAWLSAQG